MTFIPKTLYPTPDEAVAKMIKGIDNIGSLAILDPSAGHGHILEYVNRVSGRYNDKRNCFAIEIDADCRAILREKGYQVIDEDFLLHHNNRFYDVILMNPPWDEGARHVLHAFSQSGGALVKAYVNAETIRNPYSQERKLLLHLIEKHGSVEFCGQLFKDADRKTYAEAALITLQDTSVKASFRMPYDSVKPSILDFEEFAAGLAPVDIFESYEAQFNAALEAYQELLAAKRKLEFYTNSFLNDLRLENTLKECVSANYDDSYNMFLTALTKEAWSELFRKTKLKALTTGSVSREIQAMQASQGVMSFNRSNMEKLFETLFLSRVGIMSQCVLDVFDQLTKYHAENREMVEGWKTNAAYKVAKKFILPNIVETGYSHPYLSYHASILSDLEKAMCFLDGRNYETITTIQDIYRNYSGNFGKFPYGQWIDSTFFELKAFKKGSMHFKFHDDNLREKFNLLVATERKWVAEKNKQGVYN